MIEVEHLGKKYNGNDFFSLEDVSFSIKKGEIVGLIGRNGAGKTTLLRMLVKATKPTKGSILYDGNNIEGKPNMLDDFGIMIKPVFYPQLTVYDNLLTYLQINNKLTYKNNIEKTLKLVDLWSSKDRKPKEFSFGMKQRLALAISLVAEPKVLFLDEPFVGLDPVGVKEFLAILKQWSDERKVTMLISSHQLTELTDICERYIFIQKGHLENQFDSDSGILQIELFNSDIDMEKVHKINPNIKLKTNHLLAVPRGLSRSELNQLFLVLSQNNLIKGIQTNTEKLNDLF